MKTILSTLKRTLLIVWSYIRFILVMLLYGIMYVLSVFLYPFIVYPFRKHIRAFKQDGNKFAYFWWLFLNDTKKANEHDIDFGDYGRYPHNLYGAIRQSVIRNNSWNLKLEFGKGLNEQVSWMHIICTDRKESAMSLRNYKIHGYQWVNYSINGVYYFRASFSFILFNRVLWNFQAGTSGTRYLIKMRLKRI